MDEERRLIEKLLRIEALFAGATTEGERAAAGDAAARLRKRLGEVAKTDPPVEYRFSVSDNWSRKLLLALLRRYGIQPYRYHSQRRMTVMARVSKGFVDNTLWPEFVEIDGTLQTYLKDVADRIIREAIGADRADEEVRPDVADPRRGLGSGKPGSAL